MLTVVGASMTGGNCWIHSFHRGRPFREIQELEGCIWNEMTQPVMYDVTFWRRGVPYFDCSSSVISGNIVQW